MKFFSDVHRKNYEKFRSKAGFTWEDRERAAMFYICAGVRKLSDNINKIYDFEENMLCFFPEESPGFMTCSSEKALLKLACNLYNGSHPANVNDTFRNLDRNNYLLALEGIRIRFDSEYFWKEEEEEDRLNRKQAAEFFYGINPFKVE